MLKPVFCVLYLLYFMNIFSLSSGWLTKTQRNNVLLSKGYTTSERKCPCPDKSLCEPVTDQPETEVFVFSVNEHNFKKYAWDKITTIAQFGYHSDELLCYAHSKKAKVVFAANFPMENLTSSGDRSQWVKQQVQFARDNFLDGINVDFESEIPKDKPKTREGLTLLIKELATAFRQEFTKPQISVDLAWSPDCIDRRCYDYAAMADIADISFIMSYAERSQIFGDCIAWANSAINSTQHGIERFLKMGADPRKLVLGVPWYGYNYECIKYNTSSNTCHIKKVPFRGVACSDAAGSQVGYGDIIPLLNQSLTGRLWDPVAQSPYFTFKDEKTGTLHQMWYDDPVSLLFKFHMASKYRLRGVGMWNTDSVDYAETPEAERDRKAMWNTFPSR